MKKRFARIVILAIAAALVFSIVPASALAVQRGDIIEMGEVITDRLEGSDYNMPAKSTYYYIYGPQDGRGTMNLTFTHTSNGGWYVEVYKMLASGNQEQIVGERIGSSKSTTLKFAAENALYRINVSQSSTFIGESKTDPFSFVVTLQKPGAVTGLSLNIKSSTINKGATKQLKAYVKPDDATNKAVTWKSSNTGVAAVDSNGKVTGKGGGAATITCTTKDGGFTATCKITVRVPATKIKLNASKTEVVVGKTKALRVTRLDPVGVSPGTITWKTANAKVATVDSNGVVRGIKKGTTTIAAYTWNGLRVACRVTVK